MKFNNKNIWFSSDAHFGHTNIASPTISKWKEGYRNFKGLNHMNQTLIDSYNKYIGENDIFIYAGDWSFGGKENIEKFRRSLNVKEIYLTYGNHDQHIRKYSEYKSLFTYCTDSIFGLFNNVEMYINHYSHQVWENSHKGSIHLFGHSHANLKGIGRSMDIGIDNAYKLVGEYRPFHIDEIISMMSKIEIHKIDHHGAETN